MQDRKTMIPLSGADIRRKFSRFFQETHGHLYIPSASLIPTNPTVLLTPAGMLPFVPIFLGVEPPPNPPRAVSAQKCARVSGKASDLEYVGRTPRHHTFFEMLGNFSFGDYFKADVIPWAWAFVTQELGMPTDKLWVTVHHTDKEAREIWEKKVGVPSNRVIDRGDKDNFWGPPGPTGPCGPCSEIFFDRGAQYGPGAEENPEHLDDDRYVEIWNLVFMELFQDAQGKRSPLDKKNVDTGMGLERVAMVMQSVENTFETDLLFPIVKKMADFTGHRYHSNADDDVSLKIVADHIRCVAFAIGDGIIPGNEGRGYIIRMILRRAVRYAKKLGMQEPMLFKLVSTIRDLYQETYPDLKTQYNVIIETIKAEEKRFLDTLERGTKLIEDCITETKSAGKTILSGEDAFKLYDTYGFPLELTEEWAKEAGLDVDTDGFEQAMLAQREKARNAQTEKVLVSDQVYARLLQEHGPTEFLGYDFLDAEAKIIALIHNGQPVETFGGTNQPFELVLDRTPFYGESGGQVGDRGILYVPQGQQAQTIVVKDTQKIGDLFVHHCLFDQGGSVQVGSLVRAEVNPDTRARTARHHSATHLLHAALRKQLGTHVTQAGSYVGPDGARFDFTFPRALKNEEVYQIEMLVNQWILHNHARNAQVMDIDRAKASGAIAMFNEKYGDKVRVIGFGEVSTELCGGTHVDRLGDIGLVKITGEGAVASGIRRMEFVAGDLALHKMMSTQRVAEAISGLLKVPQKETVERVEKLLEDKKALDKQLQAVSEKLAAGEVTALLAKYPTPDQPIVEQVQAREAETLKFMAESIMNQRPNALVVLGAEIGGKAQFVAAVGKVWLDKGLKAGDLVKQAAIICDGGGGGKPNFAQAGGKNAALVGKALSEVSALLHVTL